MKFMETDFSTVICNHECRVTLDLPDARAKGLHDILFFNWTLLSNKGSKLSCIDIGLPSKEFFKVFSKPFTHAFVCS